jgi:hypothetical protein
LKTCKRESALLEQDRSNAAILAVVSLFGGE